MTHPDFAKAASHVTADNVRDLLMALVDIPSATGNEIGVARYLAERMRRAGLDTDLPLVEAGRPNAVGHRRGRGDGLNLLFTGHMDTSYSREMLLLAGIRRIHVAGEQEIEPVAPPAPVSDRVRPACLDQRQVGVEACPAHALGEITGDADLIAGRARDVDERHQQVADIVGGDVRGGLGEIGMSHGGSGRIVNGAEPTSQALRNCPASRDEKALAMRIRSDSLAGGRRGTSP